MNIRHIWLITSVNKYLFLNFWSYNPAGSSTINVINLPQSPPVYNYSLPLHMSVLVTGAHHQSLTQSQLQAQNPGSLDLHHVWMCLFIHASQSRDLWKTNIICQSHTECAMVKWARKPKHMTWPGLSSSSWESITVLWVHELLCHAHFMRMFFLFLSFLLKNFKTWMKEHI